jgi:Domain of unknown function (DUF6471)
MAPIVRHPNWWKPKVKGLLKAELKRRGLTYADLADKLSAIGVEDNEKNIANKISRGRFTGVFFVQCLEAIGCRTLDLDSPYLPARGERAAPPGRCHEADTRARAIGGSSRS